MILATFPVLVDASVWIDHLRSSSPLLVDLLAAQRVLTHPFVIGRLACGPLSPQCELIDQLRKLPQVTAANNDEAMQLLENQKLFGTGLTWVDVHLLASAMISGCSLWSTSKALASAADRLGLA